MRMLVRLVTVTVTVAAAAIATVPGTAAPAADVLYRTSNVAIAASPVSRATVSPVLERMPKP